MGDGVRIYKSSHMYTTVCEEEGVGELVQYNIKTNLFLIYKCNDTETYKRTLDLVRHPYIRVERQKELQLL